MSFAASNDVSFYTPVRNAAHTLAMVIESVRSQTVQPAEFFLIVDQRSSDESVAIAKASGVRIIEQNEGRLGHGRNLAIEACRTRWLASCDADVVLEPDWLAALLAAADDTVAVVGGGTKERVLTAADRYRAVTMPHNWGPLPLDNPFMLVSEMMADVRVLRGIGGYRADLFYGDDSDLCRRVRDAGYTLRYEPAACAWHHRVDTVESVLDLRWDYSFNRQRYRLEHLAGLDTKLSINRVYCLQSLSQILHSEHADTSAIAFLLWFHHALRDLRAALEHWPLLSRSDRDACCAALTSELVQCLSGSWAPFVKTLRVLLPKSFGSLPPVSQAVASAPSDRATRGLAAAPGFGLFLASVRHSTQGLLEAISHALVGPLMRSAECLLRIDPDQTQAAPASVERAFTPRVSGEDARRLASLPLNPAWEWARVLPKVRAITGSVFDRCRIVEHGRRLPVESPDAANEDRGVSAACGADTAPQIVLLPHLESFCDPKAALRDAVSGARFALVAYQPPEQFFPAVPVLSARDLASLSAAAGFRIRDFSTQAGLTRLILERAATQPPAPVPRERASIACGRRNPIQG